MIATFISLFTFISLSACGSINDIEHIVVFMQENRAFDHYYGTLRGVRGFNDRTIIKLPNGKPVWMQAVNKSYEEIPWHLNTETTSGDCGSAPEMDYPVDIAMWNQGHFDRWNSAREPGLGMSYFKRQDLEYYYALADKFTICDQYFQSTFTQTNPNRLHLFSGSNGLSVGHFPVLDNTEANPGWEWPTMGEILEESDISWRLYQEEDNFDDNGFAWFANFQKAKPGSPLYEKGIKMVDNIVTAFETDLKAGNLSQVSWIIAPAYQSEHANFIPAIGEDLSARLLAVLGKYPKVYAKTAFILNYDEQGGFFDHVPPPTPPVSTSNGKSTVTTDGEIYEGKPIGLGFRVPLILMSPWTRGGFVSSEVFDHTSVIQFIEKRFGVHCPNISPWRRTVCGDLTSLFDFDNPNATWPILPDTSDYVDKAKRECTTLPAPQVPIRQTFPVQEKGTRPSKALPYEYHVNSVLSSGSKDTLSLDISNTGTAGVALIAYDRITSSNPPKQYTIGVGKELSDLWDIVGGKYGLQVYGPNGFVRGFFGDASRVTPKSANPEVVAHYDKTTPVSFELVFNNTGNAPCTFIVRANAYHKDGPWKFVVGAKKTLNNKWSVTDSWNWYDFTVTVDTDTTFVRNFMGRIENGKDLMSDPAMGTQTHQHHF